MATYYYACVHIPPGADSSTHACEWGCNFTGSFDEVVRHEATWSTITFPSKLLSYIHTYILRSSISKEPGNEPRKRTQARGRARHTHTHTHTTQYACEWCLDIKSHASCVCVGTYLRTNIIIERGRALVCVRILGSSVFRKQALCLTRYIRRHKQRCLLGKKSVTRSSVVPSVSCAFLLPSFSLALYLNMY